jgi:hypothetical protein
MRGLSPLATIPTKAPQRSQAAGLLNGKGEIQVPIPGAGRVGPPPPNAAPIPNCPAGCELGPPTATGPIRARRSLNIRRQAAADEFARLFTPPTQPPPCPIAPLPPPVQHPCNGDEVRYAGTFIGSFTKGLRHDPNTGLVNPAAYCRLLRALNTGQGFQNLTLGCAPSTSTTHPHHAYRSRSITYSADSRLEIAKGPICPSSCSTTCHTGLK